MDTSRSQSFLAEADQKQRTMYKLLVLFAAVAVASARPGLLHGGALIGSIPTAISSQSSSIVHSAALTAPLVHAAAPVLAHAPVLAAPTLVHGPSVLTAPALTAGFVAGPALGHGITTLGLGHGIGLGHGLHL